MRHIWTKAEADELVQLYPEMTIPQLAEHFGIHPSCVRGKVFRMGLRKEQPNKLHFTDAQIVWFRLNFPHVANSICAIYMGGCSEITIRRLARKLGLSKTATFMRESVEVAVRNSARNNRVRLKGVYSDSLQKAVKTRMEKLRKKE